MENSQPPSCTCGGAQKIADLERELRRARIEMAVRLDYPVFNMPAEYHALKDGIRRSAWESGFRQGWEGRTHRDPYTAPHLCQQHRSGHAAGRAAADLEIERRMEAEDENV